MGWNDIERGLGVVGAIPGKIMGSVVEPLLGGLNVRGAYAAGRGNHQAAAMIREQRSQQRGMQQQQQRMAQMRSSWDNAFPDGEFNPNLPQHRSAVFEILREGYPGENPYDHWERILGLQVKFNEAQAKEHSTLQRYESPDPSTGKTVQMWFDPATGRSGRVSDPQGQQLPGYEAEDEGGGSQLAVLKAEQGELQRKLGELPPGDPRRVQLEATLAQYKDAVSKASGGLGYREGTDASQAWMNSPEGRNMNIVDFRYGSILRAYDDALETGNVLAFTTLVTNMAKLLDQEGVVRESDFNVIANTQKLTDQLRQWMGEKLEGKVTPEAIQILDNIKGQAAILAKEYASVVEPQYNSLRGIYEDHFVDQPGSRWKSGQFAGSSPTKFLQKHFGTGAASGPPADSGATPTGRVDSLGREVLELPDGREVVWQED